MFGLETVINFIMVFLSLVTSVLYARPQANISQSGDIQIITDNGIMWCDSMICPEHSVKCIATKTTTADLAFVIRDRKCLSGNGTILKHEDIKEPNPYPNHEIADYAEAMTSGSNIYQCTNCNNPHLREIYELHRSRANQLTSSVFDYKKRLNEALFKFQQDINERIFMDMKNMFKETMQHLFL